MYPAPALSRAGANFKNVINYCCWEWNTNFLNLDFYDGFESANGLYGPFFGLVIEIIF